MLRPRAWHIETSPSRIQVRAAGRATNLVVYIAAALDELDASKRSAWQRIDAETSALPADLSVARMNGALDLDTIHIVGRGGAA